MNTEMATPATPCNKLQIGLLVSGLVMSFLNLVRLNHTVGAQSVQGASINLRLILDFSRWGNIYGN